MRCHSDERPRRHLRPAEIGRAASFGRSRRRWRSCVGERGTLSEEGRRRVNDGPGTASGGTVKVSTPPDRMGSLLRWRVGPSFETEASWNAVSGGTGRIASGSAQPYAPICTISSSRTTAVADPGTLAFRICFSRKRSSEAASPSPANAKTRKRAAATAPMPRLL